MLPMPEPTPKVCNSFLERPIDFIWYDDSASTIPNPLGESPEILPLAYLSMNDLVQPVRKFWSRRSGSI